MIDPIVISAIVGCTSLVIGYIVCAIFDRDKDDKVTVDEFVETAKLLSTKLDVDKDGYISGAELCSLITKTFLRIKK